MQPARPDLAVWRRRVLWVSFARAVWRWGNANTFAYKKVHAAFRKRNPMLTEKHALECVQFLDAAGLLLRRKNAAPVPRASLEQGLKLLKVWRTGGPNPLPYPNSEPPPVLVPDVPAQLTQGAQGAQPHVAHVTPALGYPLALVKWQTERGKRR